MKKWALLFLIFLGLCATVPVFANDYTGVAANAVTVKNRSTNDQTLMDYSGTTSGYPIYVGLALKGAATSTDSWRICKATDSANGPTAIKCTDGIWDNRASLTYS